MPWKNQRQGQAHATTLAKHAADSRERASRGTALTRARQRSPEPTTAATRGASAEIAEGVRFPDLESLHRNSTPPRSPRNPRSESGFPREAASTGPAEPAPMENADRSNARSQLASRSERHAPLGLRSRGDDCKFPQHTLAALIPQAGTRSDGSSGPSAPRTPVRSEQRTEQNRPATSRPCLERRARPELSTVEP